jgi:hypothetical protein
MAKRAIISLVARALKSVSSHLFSGLFRKLSMDHSSGRMNAAVIDAEHSLPCSGLWFLRRLHPKLWGEFCKVYPNGWRVDEQCQCPSDAETLAKSVEQDLNPNPNPNPSLRQHWRYVRLAHRDSLREILAMMKRGTDVSFSVDKSCLCVMIVSFILQLLPTLRHRLRHHPRRPSRPVEERWPRSCRIPVGIGLSS